MCEYQSLPSLNVRLVPALKCQNAALNIQKCRPECSKCRPEGVAQAPAVTGSSTARCTLAVAKRLSLNTSILVAALGLLAS